MLEMMMKRKQGRFRNGVARTTRLSRASELVLSQNIRCMVWLVKLIRSLPYFPRFISDWAATMMEMAALIRRTICRA